MIAALAFIARVRIARLLLKAVDLIAPARA